MDEEMIGNILGVLFVIQLPLSIGLCIYNARIAKKKERKAAPFVWLTLGLGVGIIIGSTLLWALLHFPLGGYAEGFLTVLLALCGEAVSVLIAKRALNENDRRAKVLSRSLRPEHFTNGQSFSRPAFDNWIFESKKAATKVLAAYLGCIACGTLLSVLFSQGVGGVFGNVMAILCVFAGLIAGGIFSRKAGKSAENAAAYLGISSADVVMAKRHLKSGTFAWSKDKLAASDQGGEADYKEVAPVTFGFPQGTAPEKPADWQENGKRPRRKMKKWQKRVLIVAASVIALFLILVVESVIENRIRENNKIAFNHCMYACDVEGAQKYAKKLTYYDATYQDKVDRMERFLVLYDAGKWQEAIAEYDGSNRFVADGIAIAKYCECYYQIQVLPAETALNEGRVCDAIELLLQFHNRFDWMAYHDINTNTHIGFFKEYSEYFEDHGKHFADLTTRAAEAAFASNDEDTILLLEGFSGDIVHTVPFEEFTWSDDYLAWKEAK